MKTAVGGDFRGKPSQKKRFTAPVGGCVLALIAAWAACGNGGSGGGDSGNVCPEGPGQCSDGDSSTCRCGEQCVQAAECDGCSWECVKGCATDADCAGYYSGDTPPAPLVCIGASSTMPTPHCGIGESTFASSSSSGGGGTGGAGGGGTTGTPCSEYPSYDHFCTDLGYPPHFAQCTGSDVPGPGCELETNLQGISCIGPECYCCP